MTKLPISAVERDTGLSKDILRVWERRYGFPCPERDASGERAYPIEQVGRLRLLRRLVDSGHRPGKVVGLPLEALLELAGSVPTAESTPHPSEADFARLLAQLRALRVEELRQSLAQAAWRMGLADFVTGLCAPLTRRVGEAWASGTIEIYEEHLYTEVVQGVLRGAIADLAAPRGGARVLLATVPYEVHGLGLLMAEALLALEGCRCTSLGTQVPVVDIARAALAQPTDVVALSFSSSLPGGQVTGVLAQLRALLPDRIELWAGGGNPALRRRPVAGVAVVGELEGIAPRLAAWRAARSPGSGQAADLR